MIKERGYLQAFALAVSTSLNKLLYPIPLLAPSVTFRSSAGKEALSDTSCLKLHLPGPPPAFIFSVTVTTI